MGGVAARRVIAVMQYLHPCWDRAVLYPPCDAVCTVRAAEVFIPEAAVAEDVASAGERPARVIASAVVDVVRKPLS